MEHDRCVGCKYEDKDCDEHPCIKCKMNHNSFEAEHYLDLYEPMNESKQSINSKLNFLIKSNPFKVTRNFSDDRYVITFRKSDIQLNAEIIDNGKVIYNTVDDSDAWHKIDMEHLYILKDFIDYICKDLPNTEKDED